MSAIAASTRMAPEDWRPLVSVVVPVRNEAISIEACLERLVAQDYPNECIEILVVDGCSEDATRTIVERFRARHPGVALRLLENHQRTVSPAMNVGIRAARGEVIVRMDGHAVPASDYLRACVRALARSGAANVGGVVVAKGATPLGEAVALATQHPIGAGDARYRIGGRAGYVDTVPYGAFRREVFELVGLFDESLVRNQDYEINARIRAAGGRIYFDPAIWFTYTPRGDVVALSSQYFQYGWWKVETVRRHPRSLRSRQLVPPTLLVFLLSTALAAPFWAPAPSLLVLALVLYLSIVGVVSYRIARPPASPLQVLVALVALHLSWSLGFLCNAVSRGSYPFRAGPPVVPHLVTDVCSSAGTNARRRHAFDRYHRDPWKRDSRTGGVGE